ncbi:hypothetical protein BDR05DRAFT_972519 [Suillus weaverae]|nr:hypothetical protein BDR05DRAFT_972519 [Suillus weaverae]
MKLDVWHFIMRYTATVLNSSRNPRQKEVVAEISACILKKHAQGGTPAELSETFEKWLIEGTVWSAGACRGCLERPRQDICTDGSRIEGSHKGWNSLQRVHSSGITMFTTLCHDFVLRQNIHVASSHENKSDFLLSTYGSHHVHLVDGIAQLFNSLQCEGKSASSTHPLPELMQLSSMEHFGLVESTFASTFCGLLDIKTEDSESGDTDPCTNFLNEITNDNHTETILQSARPPGMTLSQHFFTIATRIDACAMHISSDVEFHLFMDMRAEFVWISFKMTPKQWAAATETYNNCLEEKNRANGSETVKKNPWALLQKLGVIEVAVMNHLAKNDFKCEFTAAH